MIREEVYLKVKRFPTLITKVYCNECGHIINTGPNYQPKFCSECGSKLEELDKIEYKNESVSYLDYVNYILDNEEFIIFKYKNLPSIYKNLDMPTPCVIGKDINDCLDYIHTFDEKNSITEDDLEVGSINEMIEWAKYCGQYPSFMRF